MRDTSTFDLIKNKILDVIGNGDTLIIIPPFYNIGFNTLGPYLLQAIAKNENYKVDVLHVDLLLASLIGVDDYKEIQESPIYWMLGERMFARSAYGLPALGKSVDTTTNQLTSIGNTQNALIFLEDEVFDVDKYYMIENICYELVQVIAEVIGAFKYKVVGVSLGFCNQLNASIALINHIKQQLPYCVSILGGSYCEGEKAKGLFSLSKHVDYVFEGESELTFVDFLHHIFENKPYPQRLIKPTKEVPLDQTPVADYKAYVHQVKTIMGDEYYDNTVRAVWYETNRGCWWAEKAQCTFCGITQIGFRQRSISKIVDDLKNIRAQMPDKHLFFTDLIMSDAFPDKLLKEGNIDDLPDIGMQLKVGRTVEDVLKLYKVKAYNILPGVESFSTKLLKKLKKGTTGKQNLFFIRNTTSFGISTQYFLLWGVPNDEAADYEQLLEIIPLIQHLQPPREFAGMQISRDAPYFIKQDQYNITNMQYWKVYDQVFPEYANKQQVANYFTGEFDNYAHQNLPVIRKVAAAIKQWKQNWGKVKLNMMHLMGQYMIYDSRLVNDDQAVTMVVEESVAEIIMQYQRYKDMPELNWAIEHKLGLHLDGWYIPLITAAPDLLLRFSKAKMLVNN